MTTPITYELAKLLKEKDFNLKVVNYYNYEKLSLIFDKDRRIGGLVNYNPINWNAVKEHYTSAPTIAEMLMWSFNTHKIWITVDVNINGKFNYLLRQFNSKDRAWEVKTPSSIQEYFNNPDDAYSSGITYFLNNFEMSK